MKKKFIILTLCFTLIFSSINYKKSYAFDFVISPTILAITATLAVGTGIVLSDNNDLYDIGRGLYNFLGFDKMNDLKNVIKTYATIASSGLITLPKQAVDTFKSYTDSLSSIKDKDISFGTTNGALTFPSDIWSKGDSYVSFTASECVDGAIKELGKYQLKTQYYNSSNDMFNIDVYINGALLGGVASALSQGVRDFALFEKGGYLHIGYWLSGMWFSSSVCTLAYANDAVIGLDKSPDYNSGVYDNVDSDGNLGIYVPDNPGSLVTNPPGDITSPYPGVLAPGGSVVFPGVDNPSIGLDTDISIPNTGTNVACPECGLVGEHAPGCSLDTTIDPPLGGIIPPFPSFGDTIDFSPMYLTNVTEKFPFSLPWDIGRLISKFDVSPKAPIFEVPLVTETIELDLTIFDEWAGIARFFILIGFILALISISTKLLG